jgi:hypothetical protein
MPCNAPVQAPYWGRCPSSDFSRFWCSVPPPGPFPRRDPWPPPALMNQPSSPSEMPPPESLPLLFRLAAEGAERAAAVSPPDPKLWRRSTRELKLLAEELPVVSDPEGEFLPRTASRRVQQIWRAYDGVRLRGLGLCSLILAGVGGPLAGLSLGFVLLLAPDRQPVQPAVAPHVAAPQDLGAELAAMRADFAEMQKLLEVQVYRVDQLVRLVAAPLDTVRIVTDEDAEQ